MSNTDIIATIIALFGSAVTITVLLMQNAQLQRAIRERDAVLRYMRVESRKVNK